MTLVSWTRFAYRRKLSCGGFHHFYVAHPLREWIWQDGERASRLARDYNERLNNLRLRNFDGSHLTLPRMVREHLRDPDLARHEKDAVWRIAQSGSTLLAHVYCRA